MRRQIAVQAATPEVTPRQLLQRALLLFLLISLVACGGSGGSGGKGSAAAATEDSAGESLLPEISELPENELTDLVFVILPDAENLIFSEAGRLFVSTALQVYEVTLEGESFVNQAIADTGCHFKGLATAGQYLYAVCKDGRLFGGVINDNPVLTEIYSFTGMCLPNGIVVGPDGNLYVVDGPVELASLSCLLPDPKIVKLLLDPSDPLTVQAQSVWLQGSILGLLSLGLDNILHLPSGLAREGNFLYGTDGGSVYRVEWLPGGTASQVERLFFRPTLLGDLALTEQGLLVTDTLGGRVLLLSRAGELLQETAGSLLNDPGAVVAGMPPLFALGDLLVTELSAGLGDLPVTESPSELDDSSPGDGGGILEDLLSPIPIVLEGLLGWL